MKYLRILNVILFALGASMYVRAQQRSETYLTEWTFHQGDVPEASSPSFDDASWEKVTIPHDWAIKGPFSIQNDLQNVAVTQNGEKVASLKTGRTGGLPYVGTGWYRTTFDTVDGSDMELVFDGAMSEARVYVNGHEACFWPCGYNSFHFKVNDFVNPAGGESNVLAVRLENRPFSSRWYPGAGLYRNVHLVCTSRKAHIPVWGTFVTTPFVSRETASVKIEVAVDAPEGANLEYYTEIYDPDGQTVTSRTSRAIHHEGVNVAQQFVLKSPKLWSPESPNLYIAYTSIYIDGNVCDRYETSFGIRSIEYRPEEGFFLNGEHRQIHGVCNHHDLGPLGAAIHEDALRHQLEMLKDMGCDAIRTSHNMPAPELVRLCDEMGFMMMLEPFDEWDVAKCENGYHRYFWEWAEKDMVNMLRQYRNNPSVILWSIGNEVPSQSSPDGYKVARFLQDICHREDPTRPVTCGMDQVDAVLSNGFAALIDIPGLNYRTFKYLQAHRELPQGFVLGSETASTVSSRGTYHFPVKKGLGVLHPDNQSNGYDTEACSWSNIPDIDFALADDYSWNIGQFVWTGFDYLGEPSPYDTNAWPSHSSVFGIIDLASLPKDRYYLYRSLWNTSEPTLHVLPHWTWPGRENKITPVYVYTSYPSAELFVNGVSHGRRTKNLKAEYPAKGLQDEAVESRYRLMWNDVRYHKGEIRVVAYDENGREAAVKVVRTAGKGFALKLEAATSLERDLIYYTVSVVDKDGNEVPCATDEVNVEVTGCAAFKAMANGDPTCLELFHKPYMHLFAGKLTVIVERTGAGDCQIKVSSRNLKPAALDF